jgi:DUF4097 and DUF4098 domain-containing protein YvlB
MKYLFTIFSLLWLSLIVVAQEEIHRSFPFDANGEIEIANARGKILVSGWDEAKVQIDAIKKGDRANFELIQIAIIEDSKTLKIGVKYPPPACCQRTNLLLELHVKVPRGVTLKSVNSQSGEITLDNIEGIVMANSLSGDIRVESCKNNCALSTNSGQIIASKIEGVTECRTLSGDINLEFIGGNTRATTASGDITLRRLRSKAYASTASGDITLEQISGNVTTTTTSGDLNIQDLGGDLMINNVSGDVSVTNVKGRATVTGVNTSTIMHSIGSGVRVTSVSGDVSLGEIKGLTEVRSTNGNIILNLIDSAEVNINSHSGDITFDGICKENGRYSFESFSGDITVYVTDNSNFTVSAKSFSGDITNDFNFKSTGTRPTRLQGTHGNESGGTISIISFSSDVNLRKKKK